MVNKKSKIHFYIVYKIASILQCFCNRSYMTSKCGKSKKVPLEPLRECATLFLPHFDDVFCNLLLDRRTATWNLIVLYNKVTRKNMLMMSSMRLSSNRS